MRRWFTSLLTPCLMMLLVASVGFAQAPRVLDKGKTPADVRLQPLKDLNGYFPFEVSKSPREWQVRAERATRQMKVALGLWPMPTATPLNPVVYGKIEKEGYTVEKAYFESFPGLYVTGNLYRPTTPGKHAAVLCPHGHWPGGRFHDAGDGGAAGQIKIEAEKMDAAAHSPLQARCVQLARMGCVVFHYDMLGYADSIQLTMQLVHRFGKQRPEMSTLTDYGFYSPQAEANVQSVMGVQAYNSVRALDFLTSLKDVDPSRLAVTGASGGGTQTFILAAIDPRPAVAFPAVMVSTSMQGGCTCENCSLLRVDTGNIEFAALFAPKPIGMTAADDWTREMETKGFPELKQHFKMLGVPNNVTLAANVQFKHNYNLISRTAMYEWFNKHLKLGVESPIVEQDFERLSTREMTVWGEDHPKPKSGDEIEREVVRWWKNDADKQLDALLPTDKKSLRAYREVVGGGIDAILGRSLPDPAVLEYDQTHKVERHGVLEMAGLLTNTERKEQLPVVFLYPKDWNGRVVVWIDAQGKAALYDGDGFAKPIARLLDSDTAVMGVDLLYQGESLAGAAPVKKTRKVANPREAAAYTFGFNHPLFARRTHDILTAVAFVRSHEYTPKHVAVAGFGEAGTWVAAARAQARDAIDTAIIDTGGFRFSKVNDIHGPQYLTGGAKYHDLPGMLAVAAPSELWLAGEGDIAPPPIASAYKSADAAKSLHLYNGDAAMKAAVDFLLAK